MMRSVFLCFALLTLTLSIGYSIPDNKLDNGINKYNKGQFGEFEMTMHNTRRLLDNQKKELRRERKQQARDKKHAKQEKIIEEKNKNNNNNVNNVNNINAYDEFQQEMDQERGTKRRENKENKNTENNNEQHTNNNGENTETFDTDFEEITAAQLQHNIAGDNGNDKGKGKNKRIFRYKFKNGFAFGTQNDEENKGNINDNTGNSQDPVKSVPKTMFKRVKSPFEVAKAYEMNQTWSKRTFWLLFCILIINVFALLYCICGRSIMAYLISLKQMNNNQNIKPKKLINSYTDSDTDDDTNDEEY